MEIEVKPISLDDRLEYIQKISENHQANTYKFPWGVAIIALLIGAGIVYAVNHDQKKRRKKVE